MRVFILKEGKEYNQGVAYLDDGTMVVVDNARKMIGKTIDVSVTSVLQTTAGKMIFGKWDERGSGHRGSSSPPPVAVPRSRPPDRTRQKAPLARNRPRRRLVARTKVETSGCRKMIERRCTDERQQRTIHL